MASSADGPMPKVANFKVCKLSQYDDGVVPVLSCHHPRISAVICFLQVHKLLGKGSYGKVYKVQRASDDKFYALKETDLGSLNHMERMDAVNEVRLLVSMSHPSVVGSLL